MKPDGTLTVEEIMLHIDELQYWEKEDIARKLYTRDMFYTAINKLTLEELNEALRGIWCYDKEMQDIENLTLEESIQGFTLSEICAYLCNQDFKEQMLDMIGDKAIMKYISNNIEICDIKVKLKLGEYESVF